MSATPDLRALLLTDVVDSTRLTEELGDTAMAGLWTVHDRVARDLLPLWRGREIDKTDGMLLLFDDVRDAVGYALAYHRGLAERALPFKARAGIHVGPVSLRPNPPEDVARGAKPVEVDGIALPIAARVMSVALGAQTLLSADARLALGVAAQRVMSHGHWRMHGVTDPVELFEVGEAGAAPFATPPDGQKVYRVARQGELWQPVREVRHSIPAERDSFVGRQEPLHVLAQKFDDGARLVSVLGMGGTGKTRLVTRFAWTGLGDYPGGVWFCDLSQARTIDGIHFAVAQGLDVPLGKTDPVVQLAHAIAGRGRCLIILDNFEQVARFAEETLGRWLDRAPLAQFLVTTREVLGIVGEEIFALAPLPMADATALFRRRAGSTRTDALSDDDVEAIEQLVKVLDGLPLAIELAAARVRVMPPRTLLARMNDRFKLLWSSSGRRDRQATLRAAFDWSWELLSEAEKAALAQLAVFEGGFTLDAAEAVIDLSPQSSDAPWTADLLQWLVDKSFVRRGAGDRFDLLESVREYAAEHLRSEGRYLQSGPAAQTAAQRRHGQWFAGANRPPTPHWPNAELDNLVAACRRSVSRGDGTVAIRTLVGAWGPLRLRGPFRVAVELSELVRTIASSLDSAAQAELALISGSALGLCGMSSEAEVHLVSAAHLAQSLDRSDIEGRALNALGVLQAQQGLLAEAETSYRRALVKARQTDDRPQQCSVLNHLGAFLEAVGRFDEARVSYEDALAVARGGQDRRWEGGSAGNLGQFFANRGHADKAAAFYTIAVSIARELGDRQWEANARCNLGLLNFSQGKLAEASTELEAALTTARQLGHAQLLSVVQCNLGLVAEARDLFDEALGHYTEAVGMASALGDQRSEGQFLGYLGLLHARRSRFDTARDCLARGISLLEAVADPESLGIVLFQFAQAEHLAGDASAASGALGRADAIAAQLGQAEPSSEFSSTLRRTRDMCSAEVTAPSCS